MPLIISDRLVAQDIFVQEFLQLQQGGGFMPANISQVVGATASYHECAWVPVFLDMHLVKGGIVIVLYPECDGPHEFVMLNEFDVTDGVYFLTSTDDLIRAAVVNKFQEV
jgi:hypothetical protein